MSEAHQLLGSTLEDQLLELAASDDLEIPPYPAVALKLQQLTSQDDYEVEDLAHLLSSDAALTSVVLRQANSVYFGARKKVASLDKAIVRIGGDALAQIAIAASVGAVATAPGPLADLKRLVWRQALLSGLFARQMARDRKVDVSEAFICGLLHDFGKTVALAGLEQLAFDQPEIESMPAEVWLEIVESSHSMLGLTLASNWELPEVVCDAITAHHAQVYEGQHRAILQLVGDCDRLVAQLEQSSELSAEQLAELSLANDPRAVASLGQFIQNLPGMVAELETSDLAPPCHPQKNLVAPPSTSLKGCLQEVDFELDLHHQASIVRYRCTALSHDGLRFGGHRALDVNKLCRMVLKREPTPLEIWANVSLCEPVTSGGFVIEAKPFGLGGEVKKRWMALCAPRSVE